MLKMGDEVTMFYNLDAESAQPHLNEAGEARVQMNLLRPIKMELTWTCH